jgi:hypothetical protein
MIESYGLNDQPARASLPFNERANPGLLEIQKNPATSETQASANQYTRITNQNT